LRVVWVEGGLGAPGGAGRYWLPRSAAARLDLLVARLDVLVAWLDLLVACWNYCHFYPPIAMQVIGGCPDERCPRSATQRTR
jgi:hypothetical protein